MATKTDYYNRIIASLQSEITGLKATLGELQEEVEGMSSALKKLTEINTSAKEIPAESNPASLSLKTLPRREVEILLSKVKTVCDEAIKANHENYVEMFAMRSELDCLLENIKTTFLSVEKFRDNQAFQDARFKSLEEKIGRRFSFLIITQFLERIRQLGIRGRSLNTIYHIFSFINPHWLLSVIVSLCICALALYLVYSTDP